MLEPTQIIEENNAEVTIMWSDGTEDLYSAPQLRRLCPCASCINEWTGEKILDERSISDDLEFSSIGIVGRYALNFKFSDGHDTGIFTFKMLREFGGSNAV